MMSPRRSEPCPGLAAHILDALARGTVDRGPHLRVFEARVAALVQGRLRFAPEARATSSGLEALAALLSALRVEAGAKVVVPAYGHGGLVPFLRSLGYRVTTVDVGDDRPCPTPAALDRACTPEVRCVIVSHLFGAPSDLPALAEVARARGAVLIEDGGYALGARLAAEPAGCLGDGATFRFDAGGPVHAFGGGMAIALEAEAARRLPLSADAPPPSNSETLSRILADVATDAARADVLRRLLSPLLYSEPIRPLAEWVDGAMRLHPPDGPVRGLSNLQARLGLAALDDLPRRMERRQATARRFLAALGLEDPRLAETAPDRSVPSDIVVRVPPGRDGAELVRDLRHAGVMADRGASLADDAGSLAGEDRPGARAWMRRALRLPGPALVDPVEIDRTSAALETFRGRVVI